MVVLTPFLLASCSTRPWRTVSHAHLVAVSRAVGFLTMQQLPWPPGHCFLLGSRSTAYHDAAAAVAVILVTIRQHQIFKLGLLHRLGRPGLVLLLFLVVFIVLLNNADTVTEPLSPLLLKRQSGHSETGSSGCKYLIARQARSSLLLRSRVEIRRQLQLLDAVALVGVIRKH